MKWFLSHWIRRMKLLFLKKGKQYLHAVKPKGLIRKPIGLVLVLCLNYCTSSDWNFCYRFTYKYIAFAKYYMQLCFSFSSSFMLLLDLQIAKNFAHMYNSTTTTSCIITPRVTISIPRSADCVVKSCHLHTCLVPFARTCCTECFKGLICVSVYYWIMVFLFSCWNIWIRNVKDSRFDQD